MAKRSKEDYAPVKEIARWYAVRIEGWVPYFALGGNGTRATFLHRKDAVEFCKQLRLHIDSKCKVVKVDATITEVV